MEESSRDSYQKLGDPGEEENNNTEKKCNKKLIIIISVVLGLVVAGVVVAIILLLNREKTCPDGQYLPSDDDSKCYDCSANCKKCTGTKSESKCTTCKDGYSLDVDICVGLFSFKGEYTTTSDKQSVQFFNDVTFIDNVKNMTIDGNEIDTPVSSYVFEKSGNHKVYFNLKSDNLDNLSSLFLNNTDLNAAVFSEDFDSTNVTNIDSMFCGCNSLTSVNLEHFITTNVDSMNEMFYGCGQLDYVDISKFSTNISEVYLFDKNYPSNGSITLTREFYDRINGQFPDTWTVHYSDSDIYDLLEN